MQNIKDFSATVVVGAFFVMGSIIILKWLLQKRLFSFKGFNSKEAPTLLAIFLLALCYISGMFLEFTSDYAIGGSSKKQDIIRCLLMPLYPEEADLKVEVLFENDSCSNLTDLGKAVVKVNLFSKYGERRYREKIEKLENKIESNPNVNLRCLIKRTYGGTRFLQILKDTTFNIYYNGKNAVYREENYFKELMDIQQRIYFIRSIGLGSWLMAILLIVGNLVLILCLPINLLFPKLFSGLFEWLKPSRILKYKNEKKRNIALTKKIIIRSVIPLIFLIGLYYFITMPTFKHEEIQFNKRIFGYFIKLDSLQKNEHMQIINVNNN
jgi:hypothetical protein